MAAENTALERTASCSCGSFTITTKADPIEVYACSCLNCQRETGSAFSYGAIFSDSAVTMTGARTTWRRIAESGRWIETDFCPTCGSTLSYRMEAWPGVTGVAAGCFADPGFARPDKLYWAHRRHHWLHLPEGITAIEN